MLKHKALTETILKAYYAVYNEMGHGFLERVYQNSMVHALREAGLHVEVQRQIKVYFKEKLVGDYFADIIVNDLVILELKAATCIMQAHELQLINYLKATNIEVGLLLNFGEKPEFRRKMWVNEKKNFNL
jgi:GxxExxY protein